MPASEERDLHGILLFDKPEGLSSNRRCRSCACMFGAAKAGHTGSLDPLATGLLADLFRRSDQDRGSPARLAQGVRHRMQARRDDRYRRCRRHASSSSGLCPISTTRQFDAALARADRPHHADSTGVFGDQARRRAAVQARAARRNGGGAATRGRRAALRADRSPARPACGSTSNAGPAPTCAASCATLANASAAARMSTALRRLWVEPFTTPRMIDAGRACRRSRRSGGTCGPGRAPAAARGRPRRLSARFACRTPTRPACARASSCRSREPPRAATSRSTSAVRPSRSSNARATAACAASADSTTYLAVPT